MFDEKAYMKKYYQKNKECYKERAKRWQKDNPEKKKEIGKRYYKNHQENFKRYDIKRRYGLSHEDWLKIWETQDGKCAICEKKFANPSKTFVDHNHETGKIRGLLCPKCNLAIGLLNDDPKLMAKVIEYLLR